MTATSRSDAITFQGRPVTLLGPPAIAGAPAPAFTVLAADFSPVTLDSSAGQVRILSAVPSLDTPVCDQQTRRFHQEASTIDGVTVLTISADLPFAQRRWCAAADLPGVQTLSDHRDLSFGHAYGLVIAEFRLLARAVFVVDADDQLTHVQYVPEVGQEPDYEAALGAARKAAG
ncbi:thiol peroxidase [Micromonospora sp. WMMD1082]|uniref:thiol peroxidase n=1 Tax=Micromonospora sp. WMMD1082 TaxID=3016104 RepID=UPI002417EB4B|nr:thiol peroxidase [Micromonospora sp. WMMD1082]MDG4792777.1 thiol peroxidase [Micromonospora sp. WMMD1082]